MGLDANTAGRQPETGARHMDNDFREWLEDKLEEARLKPQTATFEWVELLATAAYERGRIA